LELAVGALAEVDGAHAAAADLAHDTVGADAVGEPVELEKAAAGLVGAEQGLDLGAKAGVGGAGLVEKGGARGAVDFEGVGDDLLHAVPAGGGHDSSRLRKRRATDHSRLTVAVERPRTSAVSSTVRPPKTRSSTISPWRGSSAARRSRARLRLKRSAVASRSSHSRATSSGILPTSPPRFCALRDSA